MPPNKSELAKARGFDPKELAEAVYEHNTMPVVNATQYAHDQTTRFFQEYLTTVHEYTESQCNAIFTRGLCLPQTNILKGYMEWLCQGTEGKIQSNISLTSLETMFYRLRTVLRRSTGHALPPLEGDDILAFIRTSLRVKYDLATKMKEKGYSDEIDSEILMEQLWCFDTDEITERHRVQLAFLVLLHVFSGLRPGSILPDQHYQDNSLKYEHCAVFLTLPKDEQGRDIEDSRPQLYLNVSQFNMKGRKHSEKFLTTTLTEADKCYECPILLFLALAFADDAFEDISTPDQLFQIRPLPRTKRRIPFKPSKLSESIFKFEYTNQNSRGPISDLQYRQFWEQLKNLSRRASYHAHIKPYDIRRGVANRLDENVSESQRNQILGHVNGGEFQKSYQMAHSTVNIQALMLRKDMRWNADMLLRKERGGVMPINLLSRVSLSIKTQVDACQTSKRCDLRRKLVDLAWREVKSDPLLSGSSKDGQLEATSTHSAIANSVENLGDLRLRRTRAQLMLKHFPLRKAVADSVRCPKKFALRDDVSLLHTLIELSRTDRITDEEDRRSKQVAGKYPENLWREGDLCSLCNQCISMQTISQRLRHVSLCAKRYNVQPLPPKYYCTRCNRHMFERTEYIRHCKDHYHNLDLFCGVVRLRNTLVVPGRCPFCIGHAGNFPWQFRMVEFATLEGKFGLLSHLRMHVKDLDDGHIVCPHPICNKLQENIPDLLHHFCDEHGIEQTINLIASAPGHYNADNSLDNLSCPESPPSPRVIPARRKASALPRNEEDAYQKIPHTNRKNHTQESQLTSTADPVKGLLQFSRACPEIPLEDITVFEIQGENYPQAPGKAVFGSQARINFSKPSCIARNKRGRPRVMDS